jgi:hypothetical protein
MTLKNVTQGHSSPPSTANLWLAIGDETGRFEDPQSSGLHGVGLILARPAALIAALNENLAGKTIRSRMDSPVEGLKDWLLAQGAAKADELRKHHVREAWLYLQDGKRIKGELALDAIHNDPVLTHLLAVFRWLAGHSGIVSLGIHGSGREVMTDFSMGSDPMAAIGALYGRILALVKPFLGVIAKNSCPSRAPLRRRSTPRRSCVPDKTYRGRHWAAGRPAARLAATALSWKRWRGNSGKRLP